MNILSLSDATAIQFQKSSGLLTITLEAGRDYLVSDAQFDRIIKDETLQKRIYKLSKTQARFTNFHVGIPKANGTRILLFQGSGGYGDHILTWPLAKILHSMGYEVHILVDPGNHFCYWNFPWIKSVNLIPVLLEHVKFFNYFLNFEVVSNNDEHQDQLHPLDAMLKVIGIDPDSIDSALKVVRPNFTHNESWCLFQQFKDKGPLAMYQLSAANPVRSLPANDSVFMALRLAEDFPDLHWLCLYDQFVPEAYKTTLEAKIEELKLKNIQPFCAPGLRELWGLAQHAKVIVAPDSMMVHVAGALDIPCVGLWGPVHPVNRARYYKQHFPIYHREFCAFSPCFCYFGTFPRYCPPRPGGRTVCECLAGIAPQEVSDAIRKIRKS